MWNQVDDFDWLKEEHSPHWSVVSEPDLNAVLDQATRSMENNDYRMDVAVPRP